MSKFKVSAGLWILDTFAERDVPRGYHEPMELDEQLEVLSRIRGLDGLGVVYPAPPLPDDPDKLVKKLGQHNLKVGDVTVDNYAHRKWRHGAFVTTESAIRRENIRLCKDAMDFAAAIPGAGLTLWPGHDGFDYPFQTDYRKGWKNLVDSCQQICGHNPKVKVAIEYKQKDPRQKQYLSNMGKTMMLINDVRHAQLDGRFGHRACADEPGKPGGKSPPSCSCTAAWEPST